MLSALLLSPSGSLMVRNMLENCAKECQWNKPGLFSGLLYKTQVVHYKVFVWNNSELRKFLTKGESERVKNQILVFGTCSSIRGMHTSKPVLELDSTFNDPRTVESFLEQCNICLVHLSLVTRKLTQCNAIHGIVALVPVTRSFKRFFECSMPWCDSEFPESCPSLYYS